MSGGSAVGSGLGRRRDDGQRLHDDGAGSGRFSLDDGSPDAPVETSSGFTERTLLYVIVDPGQTVLELDLGARSSLRFTATAIYDDGSSADVTREVTWEVSNPVVGEMSGSTLEIVAQEVDDVVSAVVTAEIGEQIGRAQLTVVSHRRDQDFVLVLPLAPGDAARAEPLTFDTDLESVDALVRMYRGPAANVAPTRPRPPVDAASDRPCDPHDRGPLPKPSGAGSCVVEDVGFEPATSGLQSRRSPS